MGMSTVSNCLSASRRFDSFANVIVTKLVAAHLITPAFPNTCHQAAALHSSNPSSVATVSGYLETLGTALAHPRKTAALLSRTFIKDTFTDVHSTRSTVCPLQSVI